MRAGAESDRASVRSASISSSVSARNLRTHPSGPPKKRWSSWWARISATLGVRGSLPSSRSSRSPGLRGQVPQITSVPPEARAVQLVSRRLASASAMVRAVSGTQRSRSIHWSWPSRSGSRTATTRRPPAAHSLRKRRATVWSETPSTAPIRLKEARPSTSRAERIRRSSVSKVSDAITGTWTWDSVTVRLPRVGLRRATTAFRRDPPHGAHRRDRPHTATHMR